MKKLVLHIGLPKTGTTTVQEWLVQLCDSGMINYLGKRNDQNADTNINFYKDLMMKWGQPRSVRTVSKCRSEIKREMSLSDKKVNVLSSEAITAYSFQQKTKVEHHTETSASDYVLADEQLDILDPFDLPVFIDELLSNVVDNIEIVATIRNQQEIIHSGYVQNYRLYVDDPSLKHWNQFLDRTLSADPPLSYDYSDLLSAYGSVFGRENVTVLLFEDLVDNKREFADSWRRLLDLDEAAFFDAVDLDVYKNKGKKSDDEYYRETFDPSGKKVMDFLSAQLPTGIKTGVKRHAGGTYQSLRDGLFKKEFAIEKPDSSQKQRIHDRFRGSNEELVDFGVDRRSLETYEYV